MKSMMGGPLEKLSTSNDPIAVYIMRVTPTYCRECSPAQHRLDGTVNGVKETKEHCITLNLTAKGQLQTTNHSRVAERRPALESHSYSKSDADQTNDERQTHFKGKQRVLLIRTSSWLSLAILLELHKDVSTRGLPHGLPFSNWACLSDQSSVQTIYVLLLLSTRA